MNTVRQLTILARQSVVEAKFITFWSSLYEDPQAKLYRDNINLPSTDRRLWKLFKWKNGGKIAKRKRRSIEKNYITNKPQAPVYGNFTEERDFIISAGGAIWRIFWLHCYSPTQYPIFDQHVYRAMLHIKGKPISKLPPQAEARANIYLKEYRQFFSTFGSPNKKKIDEALWAYGKFLSRYPKKP